MPEITPPPVPNDAPATPPAQAPAEVDVEQQEWDNAANELFPGLKKEEADPKAPEEPKAADQPTPPADPTKQPENPENPENPTPQATPQPKADLNSINARMAQRQFAAQVEAIRSEVREKMFANTAELKDADGDPIKGIEDIMSHIDPRTGEPFTEEAATAYWTQAQAQLSQQQQQAEKEIDRIANINATIKDEADVVNEKYGELLNGNPELRAKIWAQFGKTLQVDPTSQIILNAPVSLLEFYDAILQPYAEASSTQQQAAQAAAEAARQQEEAKKQAEEAKKKQARVDRSDIYGAGKADQMDEEEKEWADAAKAVFG